jgi:spectinomycin phosphotransferase
MHTPPADLPEAGLRAALETGWSLTATSLVYRPVGFGSHHWELTDSTGRRWFATVDDLRTRRFALDEPLAAGYQRLRAALGAAQALRAADRDFVIAPLANHEGEPLIRLAGYFAVAVYPFVEGESLEWDTFTPQHRQAALDLVVSVHLAPPPVRDLAHRDDYGIPFRGTLHALLEGSLRVDAGLGPYTQPAVDLLTSRSSQVRRALSGYDELVATARAESPELVLTHGEPHPGNIMRTKQTWLLIDWDTALAAPPERDLWDLGPGDGKLHSAYTAATGIVLNRGLLDLYRLRWDLTELAVCMARFCEPHADTADDEETWTILNDLPL